MEISQLEIFAQVGQLYAENTVLKRQINELASENQQLKSQLQPNIGTAVERAANDAVETASEHVIDIQPKRAKKGFAAEA